MSRKSRRKAWMVAAVLTVGAILYVLGCGPTFALHIRGYISRDAYAWFYRPLVSCVEVNPQAERVYIWYVNEWNARWPFGPET